MLLVGTSWYDLLLDCPTLLLGRLGPIRKEVFIGSSCSFRPRPLAGSPSWWQREGETRTTDRAATELVIPENSETGGARVALLN